MILTDPVAVELLGKYTREDGSQTPAIAIYEVPQKWKADGVEMIIELTGVRRTNPLMGGRLHTQVEIQISLVNHTSVFNPLMSPGNSYTYALEACKDCVMNLLRVKKKVNLADVDISYSPLKFSSLEEFSIRFMASFIE
jgi:hypothetical protein